MTFTAPPATSSSTAPTTSILATTLPEEKQPEEEARKLLKEENFSYEALQDIVEAMDFHRAKKSKDKLHGERVHKGTMMFGLYAYGNQFGISNNTRKYPAVCAYVNKWLDHVFGDSLPGWTSFVINVNMRAFPHGDHHNRVHTFNGTVSLGSFCKGELWIQCPPGEPRGAQDSLTQWRKTKQGKRVLGKLISTRRSPLVFDPKLLHATCRWTGTRISLTAYTARTVDQASDNLVQELREYGFRVKVPQAPQTVMMCSADEDPDDEQSRLQCEHDYETVFDQHESCSAVRFDAARMLKHMYEWVTTSRRALPRRSKALVTSHEPDEPRGEDGPVAGRRDTGSEASGTTSGRGHLEAFDHVVDDDVGNGETASGGGLHRTEGRPPLRREGDRASGQSQSSPEEGQGGADCAGTGKTTTSLESPREVQSPSSRMQPPGRCSSVPSQCEDDVVDLHRLRVPVGTLLREEPGHPRTRESGRESSETSWDARRGISSFSSTSQGQAGTGSASSGLGSTRKAEDGTCAQAIDDIHYAGDDVQQPEECGGVVQGLCQGDDPWTTILFNGDNYDFEGEKNKLGIAPGPEIQVDNKGRPPRGVRAELGRGHPRRCRDGGDPGGGDPCRALNQGRWLVHGSSLPSSNCKNLQELGKTLQVRGWILKTVLVMLSMAQSTWHSAEFLNRPTRDTLLWNHRQQEWKGWPAGDEWQPHPGDVRCEVWNCEDMSWDWLSDTEGKSFPLNKEVNQRLVDMLSKNQPVFEIYSPPRVLKKVQKFGLKPGLSMDLKTGWDFSLPADRQEALRLLSVHRPALTVLSPPCTTFSTLRFLSNYKRDKKQVEREQQGGKQHLNFAIQLANVQMDAGRGFLFEHPARATSWNQPGLKKLAEDPRVFSVEVDMCAFGLKHPSGMPAKKPTLLLTNIEDVAKTLPRRCRGNHPHAPLLSGSAAEAAKYTPHFVEAILRGLTKHLQQFHYPIFGLPDQDGQLVCRHLQPRHSPPTPAECKQFQVDALKFTGKRIIVKNFVDGRNKVVEDHWPSSVPAADATPWSGTTSFAVEPEVILPDKFVVCAAWIAKAAAHDLHHYLTTEQAFQAEYAYLFPSHRILGHEGVDRQRRPANFAPPTPAEATDAMEVDSDEEAVAHELREQPDFEANEHDDEEVYVAPPLRRELYRVHRNLGHPDLNTFVRALKHAGVKNDILRWVRRCFRCPICESRKKPDSHRPAHLTKAMGFNEVVGVDLMFFHKKILVNMVCWGTSYQWVQRIKDKSSEEVTRAVMTSWVAHYGPPRLLVADQGTEFTSRVFTQTMSDQGVMLHFADIRAPWQNARTERFGGIWKSKLALVLDETVATTEEEFDIAVAATTWARNMMYNRSGFSPRQRVFGTSLRLPASVLSDDYLDRNFLAAPETDYMKKAAEMRERASKAWLEDQDRQSVAKAARSNVRTSDLKPVAPGDVVFVWRATQDYTGWAGPGFVVAEASNGRSLWVSVRGYLVKAAREQVRRATSEESLGVEIMKTLTTELLEDLESGRSKSYKDIEDEGMPNEDDDVNSPSMTDVEDAIAAQEAREVLQRENLEIPLASIPEEEDDSVSREGAQRATESELSTREPSMAPEGGAMGSRRSSVMEPEAFPGRRTIRVDEGSSGTMAFGPMREDREEAARAMPYPFTQGPMPWPSAGNTSTFMEVNNKIFDCQDGARWWFDKVHGRWEIAGNEKKAPKFTAALSWVFYSYADKRFYLTKKKESPGQVEFSKLPEKEKEIFRKARDKEIKPLLDSGAIKILSLEESRKFRKEFPDRVLPSRYVDRWKPTEEFSVLPENFQGGTIEDEKVAP